jgi:putative membrane protein
MLIEPIAKQLASGWNGRFIGTVVPMDQLGGLVLQTLVFALMGILVFALAFWIIVKATPFSVRKEIEEDQNVAIAVLIGAIIIAIAIVIAAAIQG